MARSSRPETCGAQTWLRESWLNDGVSSTQALSPPPPIVSRSAPTPRTGNPGLRVLVAKPEYLFAMKAVARAERGSGRDLIDLVRLGQELDVDTRDAVIALVDRFFPSHVWPAAPDVPDEIAQAIAASRQVQP